MAPTAATEPRETIARTAAAPAIPLAAVLFALGFLSAIAQIGYAHGAMMGAFIERMSIARSLAHHGTFADPFTAGASGPTAHVAPLYPALLAVLIRIFGESPRTGLVMLLMAACFSGWHSVLLPRVSKVILGSARPGVYAAVIAGMVPVMQLQPQFEAIPTATGILLFCLLAARARRWWAAGICGGLVLLTNPAAILAMVPIAWWCAGSRRRAASIIGLAVLVCSPWIVRNCFALGEPSFIRDNLGLELSISNNDCAQSSQTLNLAGGCEPDRHPNYNPAEAGMVAQMGEAAYNHRRMAMALEWMGSHPAAFGKLTARRIVEFWFPNAFGFRPFAYGIWIVTAASFAGLVRAARRRQAGAGLLWAILLLYPPLFYFIQTDMLYRYPIFWVSLLGAGYWVAELHSGPWSLIDVEGVKRGRGGMTAVCAESEGPGAEAQ